MDVYQWQRDPPWFYFCSPMASRGQRHPAYSVMVGLRRYSDEGKPILCRPQRKGSPFGLVAQSLDDKDSPSSQKHPHASKCSANHPRRRLHRLQTRRHPHHLDRTREDSALIQPPNRQFTPAFRQKPKSVVKRFLRTTLYRRRCLCEGPPPKPRVPVTPRERPQLR